MPRRNRRAPAEPAPVPGTPRSAAPLWALTPGADVRRVRSDKPYRCPGCDLEVRPGTWHFAVVPQDAPDERRHWHERCWQIELNRTRGRPSGQ
ncbi:MAG TPA: hypothetical protein VJ774_02030 [Actinomycetota bacterium]|nr:hypothetical protein [Actinomycetota bacterium]